MSTTHAKPATRREFLKLSTAAAAVSLAAPYVWSAETQKAEAKNDRLNIGVIGTGGRAGQITGGNPKIGIPGAMRLSNLIACADVNKPRAEKFAQRFADKNKCQVYADYRELLQRKDIDAILCASPDHWHVKIAIDALRAGKDVYCEKPLTITIGEGRMIRKVVEETGKILQVGTQQRTEYPSKFARSDKILPQAFLGAIVIAKSGRLGEKLHATCNIDHAIFPGKEDSTNSEPPKGFNWDFWLGQAPSAPFCENRASGMFRYWYEYAGGEITDGGVHHVDIALWALGWDQTGAVEAQGTGTFRVERELIRDAVMGRKPFADLPLRYNTTIDSDTNFHVPGSAHTLSLKTAKDDFSIYIEGERGRIRVNRNGLHGKPIEEIVASEKDWKWLQEEIAKLYRGMPLKSHMENFFHCIKTREKPISDVWTHVNSANTCHLANISILLDRKIAFDPQKYAFVSDEEANVFINRKQREPWAFTA
jgi:myo-inositol 2-dehydrogenase / D-chiro-inositol 1-dehydrogenase